MQRENVVWEVKGDYQVNQVTPARLVVWDKKENLDQRVAVD